MPFIGVARTRERGPWTLSGDLSRDTAGGPLHMPTVRSRTGDPVGHLKEGRTLARLVPGLTSFLAEPHLVVTLLPTPVTLHLSQEVFSIRHSTPLLPTPIFLFFEWTGGYRGTGQRTDVPVRGPSPSRSRRGIVGRCGVPVSGPVVGDRQDSCQIERV